MAEADSQALLSAASIRRESASRPGPVLVRLVGDGGLPAASTGLTFGTNTRTGSGSRFGVAVICEVSRR